MTAHPLRTTLPQHRLILSRIPRLRSPLHILNYILLFLLYLCYVVLDDFSLLSVVFLFIMGIGQTALPHNFALSILTLQQLVILVLHKFQILHKHSDFLFLQLHHLYILQLPLLYLINSSFLPNSSLHQFHLSSSYLFSQLTIL